MSTPYATPKHPGVPHPTPATQNSTRKTSRAPIHNPYDKFTQPEFDAWIGGLTNALKRALGREDYAEIAQNLPEQAEHDDDTVDDSFAEIKARRAAKGKERAIDVGNEEHPILLDSDSEEEVEKEIEEDDEVENAIFSREEVLQESAEGEDEEEEQEDQEDEGSEGEDGDNEEDENGDNEEYEEQEHAAGEFIDLLSDDSANESGNLQARTPAYAEEVEYDEDAEGSDEDSDEKYQATLAVLEGTLNGQQASAGQQDDVEEYDELVEEGIEESEVQPVDLPDPWIGPNTYAQDYYSGGDVSMRDANPHVLDAEVDEAGDVDDSIVEESPQRVEISDPWDGPRTYAEDYYAGGDLRESDMRTRPLSPSHLTSRHDDIGTFLTPEGLTPEAAPISPKEGVDGVPEEIAPVVSAVSSPLDADAGELVDAESAPPRDTSIASGSLIKSSSETLVNYNREVEDKQPSEEHEQSPVSAGQRPLTPEESLSPPPPMFSKHVDWNWPPAFSVGRMASRSGHLMSSESQPEVYEISDDEEDADVGVQQSTLEDVPAESDDQRGAGQGPDEAYDYPLELDAQERLAEPYFDFDSMLAQAVEQERQASERVADTADEASTLMSTLASFPGFYINADDSRAEPDAFNDTILSGLAAGGGSAHLDVTNLTLQYPLDEPEDTAEQGTVMDRHSLDEQVDTYSVNESDISVRDSVPDVTSVDGGEPTEGIDYVVEEPFTEGRRTEEPDSVQSSRQPTPETTRVDLRESSVYSISPPKELVEIVAEYLVVEPGDQMDTAIDSEVSEQCHDQDTERLLVTILEDDIELPQHNLGGDIVLPSSKAADIVESEQSTEMKEPSNVALVVVTDHLDIGTASDAREDPQDDLSALHTQHKKPELMENGVPMPISADPDIPDPTSVLHTPVSPTSPANLDIELKPIPSPASDTSNRAESPVANAPSTSSSVSDDASSHQRSGSGLFTPLTADNSRPVTPKPKDLPSGEDTYTESPLKHVVTVVPAGELHQGDVSNMLAVIHPQVVDESGATQVKTSVRSDPNPDDNKTPTEATTAKTSTSVLEDGQELIGVVSSSQLEPSESELTTESQGTNTAPHVGEALGEADAEGDADPDYLVTATNQDVVSKPDVPEDPFEINANKETPQAAKHQETQTEKSEPEGVTNGVIEDSAPTKEDVKENPITVQSTNKPEEAFEIPPKDAPEDALEDRPLKRKHGVPALPPRITRSMSNIQSIQRCSDQASRRPRKGKGEHKDDEVEDREHTSPTPSHSSLSIASSSGDSIVPKLLMPPSQTSSRASSVISTAPSHDSLVIPASPTDLRTGSYPRARELPPPPFIHANGVLHHRHGRPDIQIPPPVVRSRAGSPFPPPALASSSQEAAAEPGPSSQPVARTREKLVPSSPVTRSNCRFHKISLPREENGPRVHFVVPGCSLIDRELMEEEHIEDHGLATITKDTRLVSDLEALDFNLELLGILRHLTGPDLIREREVFYLPEPGEQLQWKSRRKSTTATAKLSARSAGPSNRSRRDSAGSSTRIAPNEPPSRAGSVSTTSSGRRKAPMSQRSSIATTASVSESELSDEEEGPAAKRFKDGDAPVDSVEVVAGSEAAVSKASAAVTRRLGVRRSRRLGTDAAAYKPNEHDDAGSSGEDDTQKTKRKTKKGVKRRRTDVSADGQDQDVMAPVPSKRRRVKSKNSTDAGTAETKEKTAS